MAQLAIKLYVDGPECAKTKSVKIPKGNTWGGGIGSSPEWRKLQRKFKWPPAPGDNGMSLPKKQEFSALVPVATETAPTEYEAEMRARVMAAAHGLRIFHVMQVQRPASYRWLVLCKVTRLRGSDKVNLPDARDGLVLQIRKRIERAVELRDLNVTSLLARAHENELEDGVLAEQEAKQYRERAATTFGEQTKLVHSLEDTIGRLNEMGF